LNNSESLKQKFAFDIDDGLSDIQENQINIIDEDFYLRHQKLIAGIATRILSQTSLRLACKKQDVEDCTNEIFAVLMSKISEYNPQRGTIEAYVSVISRSVALNFAKKLRLNQEIATGEEIDIVDVSTASRDEYNIFADSEVIKESLYSLTKDEKVLFTLKYVYYYTANEIAKYCGISVAAAEKRSTRLKKKLQKLLKEKGFDY
jgi:RNA polymerase sigma-70 factor (ECF subfamily)